jgi:hypothetical protein
LAKTYGAETARNIFAAQASALFSNTTILNDEELREANLYKLFDE